MAKKRHKIEQIIGKLREALGRTATTRLSMGGYAMKF
jgi:hypothetical protein